MCSSLVRPGQSRLRSTENAIERLKAGQVHVIGIVVNGAYVVQGQPLAISLPTKEGFFPGPNLAMQDTESGAEHQIDRNNDPVPVNSASVPGSTLSPSLENEGANIIIPDAESSTSVLGIALVEMGEGIAAQDAKLTRVLQQLELMEQESSLVERSLAVQLKRLDELQQIWECERHWYQTTLQTSFERMEKLHESLLDQQAMGRAWEEKAHKLESHMGEWQEQGLTPLDSGANQTQIEQQQELSRLRTASAEYRLILTRKEELLEAYVAELAAVQLALTKQQNELQFYKSVTGISETPAEGSLSGQASGKFSAD